MEEEQRRFLNFVDNHEKVYQHNNAYEQGLKSYRMKLNVFSDMDHKEFVATMNGYRRNLMDPSVADSRSMFLAPLNVQVPTEVDWRQEGYVTPVKNQVSLINFSTLHPQVLEITISFRDTVDPAGHSAL